MLWPLNAAEGMASLNFCAHCALSNDEVIKLSQKRSGKGHNLNLLKWIQRWSSKLQIGIDKAGLFLKSITLVKIPFHSLCFYNTRSCLTKATKATCTCMQLHPPSSYQQNTSK